MVARDLFKQENPLGKFIDIGNSVFKVIGVFQDDGGDREERYIYIPIHTRQLLEKSNDKVDQIILAFKPQIGHSGSLVFERKLREFFKKKKSIAPKDPNGILIRNRADQIKTKPTICKCTSTDCNLCGPGYLDCRYHWNFEHYGFCCKRTDQRIGN